MSVPNEPNARTELLPVMQLNTWVPASEPLHMLVGGSAVLAFLWFVQRTTDNVWITIVTTCCLAVAQWRLWLPIGFELDARGVQQIVMGRRKFWPWAEFARYEVDPQGVALIRDPRDYPLARAKGVYISTARRHMELVYVVDAYLSRRVDLSAPTVRQAN